MTVDPPALSGPERAALGVLRQHPGRLVSRTAILRGVGTHGVSPRRADALVVGVRRALGPGAITTVRGRGWILTEPPPGA